MPVDPAATVHHWVAARHGEVPRDAPPHGHDADGSPLWLARAWIFDGLHLGKVRPGLGGARIAWGGQEHVVPEYQVLVGPGVWVAASGGALPPRALPFGHEAGGEALFAARARAGAGLHPGKFRPGLGAANVGLDGGEFSVADYEVLVDAVVEPDGSVTGTTPKRYDSAQAWQHAAPPVQGAPLTGVPLTTLGGMVTVADDAAEGLAAVFRTDFGDDAAWATLQADVASGGAEFDVDDPCVTFVEDHRRQGATATELAADLPPGYEPTYFFVFDDVAARLPGHPVLVVSLDPDDAQPPFRATAVSVHVLDANLSLANVDFDEYAEQAAGMPDGIFGWDR